MLRIAHFEFDPRWYMVLAYVIVGGIMLRLGVWQLNQAERKKHILAAIDNARSTNPVPLASLGNLQDAALLKKMAAEHTRITVHGQYLNDRQFLWDNRIHKGQAGFEVITPFASNTGELLLVNRGWIAPGATRQDLPDVSMAASLANNERQVTGYFSQPSKGLASGDALDSSAGWPMVVQFFDYTSMAAQLPDIDAPLIAGVLQPQDAQHPVQGDDLLVANWEPTASIGPSRHYSYAFQWFAMATALTLLFIYYNIRKAGAGNHG